MLTFFPVWVSVSARAFVIVVMVSMVLQWVLRCGARCYKRQRDNCVHLVRNLVRAVITRPWANGVDFHSVVALMC